MMSLNLFFILKHQHSSSSKLLPSWNTDAICLTNRFLNWTRPRCYSHGLNCSALLFQYCCWSHRSHICCWWSHKTCLLYMPSQTGSLIWEKKTSPAPESQKLQLSNWDQLSRRPESRRGGACPGLHYCPTSHTSTRHYTSWCYRGADNASCTGYTGTAGKEGEWVGSRRENKFTL